MYLDLKKNQEKTLSLITDATKDLETAKGALENAPIRTGQRQDALEDYFTAQKHYAALLEKYRYDALKALSRKKQDRKEYEAAFKDKKPWSTSEDYKIYVTERRLATAPKEWDPKNRIKKREPAQAPPQEEGPKGE